jgi:hypothetical protein
MVITAHEGDEKATLFTLTAHCKIIDSLIEQHHDRFVNSARPEFPTLLVFGRDQSPMALCQFFRYEQPGILQRDQGDQ